jgi:hypothetical protein
MGAMDDYMRSKLPEELRADKDVEARACSFLHVLCAAEAVIACYLLLSTVFLLFPPHMLAMGADVAVGQEGSHYSSVSSSTSYFFFSSSHFFFSFSSTFSTYFSSSTPSSAPSSSSSSLSSSSASSSSLTTAGGASAVYSSSSCSTSSIAAPSSSSFSFLDMFHSTHTAAVMVTVAGVALVVHAALVCLLLRTRALRTAMAAYLLYLDLNFILWCISEGRGVHSSGFLGFSVLTRTPPAPTRLFILFFGRSAHTAKSCHTVWTSFMLGIRAGLASLGLMLVQAVAFHALTPIPSVHGGVESRVAMLVVISLSAILFQRLCEESKDRLRQKNDELKSGTDARTKFFNSLSHGTFQTFRTFRWGGRALTTGLLCRASHAHARNYRDERRADKDAYSQPMRAGGR